jgi:hypothetical protein
MYETVKLRIIFKKLSQVVPVLLSVSCFYFNKVYLIYFVFTIFTKKLLCWFILLML